MSCPRRSPRPCRQCSVAAIYRLAAKGVRGCKAKDIGGKIQEEVGKAVGSSEQQAKGLSKQVEGKVQEKAGDLRDAINKGNR